MTPIDRDILDQLASAAHELWCRHMLAAGWRPGEKYDPGLKSHDALVPYERLSAFDQRQVRIGIECLELEPSLSRSVRHDRGPNRELRLSEVHVGMPVQFTGPSGIAPVEAEGVVESWTPGPDDSLKSVTVRFRDGELVEYCPSECELRRADESAPAAR